jgi:hypothetical protein
LNDTYFKIITELSDFYGFDNTIYNFRRVRL